MHSKLQPLALKLMLFAGICLLGAAGATSKTLLTTASEQSGTKVAVTLLKSQSEDGTLWEVIGRTDNSSDKDIDPEEGPQGPCIDLRVSTPSGAPITGLGGCGPRDPITLTAGSLSSTAGPPVISAMSGVLAVSKSFRGPSESVLFGAATCDCSVTAHLADGTTLKTEAVKGSFLFHGPKLIDHIKIEATNSEGKVVSSRNYEALPEAQSNAVAKSLE